MFDLVRTKSRRIYWAIRASIKPTWSINGSPPPEVLPGRWKLGLSITLLFCISTIFGWWAKHTQLGFVSGDLPSFYPWAWWLEDTLTVVLVLVIAWCGSAAAFNHLCGSSDLGRFLMVDAATTGFLLLVLLGVPFGVSVGITVGAKLLTFLALARPKYQAALSYRVRQHAVAFVIILLCQIVFNQFCGPVAWQKPMEATPSSYINELPLFNSQYTNAKFLSFSDFDHAYWGGPPRFFETYSLVLPLAALVLNAPSADVEWYTRLVLMVIFFLCLAGSFGFYLFLSEGLQFSYVTAVLGGVLFVFRQHVLHRHAHRWRLSSIH